jgi:hypothetical protein
VINFFNGLVLFRADLDSHPTGFKYFLMETARKIHRFFASAVQVWEGSKPQQRFAMEWAYDWRWVAVAT